MSKSEFARVIFHLPRDTFPPDSDFVCPFEITPDLEASKWDWVGIFPVGWKCVKDYYTYQYVNLENYESKSRSFLSIKFEANALPQDKNFYQICYISQSTSVCGASDAIQFLNSVGRDFVEVECEDMMVVREKADVMKEEMQNLAHNLFEVNKDREDLQEKVALLTHKLELREEDLKQLQDQICDLQACEKQQSGKVDMLQDELKQCTSRLAYLHKEKDSLQLALNEEKTRALDMDSQLSTMKVDLRTLLQEKDELSGRNQSLINELDSYKTQVTENQTKLAQSGKTIHNLNAKLEQALNECSTVVEECESLKCRANMQAKEIYKLERQIDELIEDKVEAENQESELRSVQAQLEHKALECAELRNNVRHLEVELAHLTKEMQLVELNLSKSWNEAQETSTHRDTLAKDYARVEKKYSETHLQLQATMMQLKEANNDKSALKAQLREFEEQLTESLAVRDKEVSKLLKELKEKEAELQQRDAQIQGLKGQGSDMHNEMSSLVKDMQEMQGQLVNTERLLKEQQAQLKTLDEENTRLKQERGIIDEKLREIKLQADSMAEREAMYMQKEEEDKASHFCLLKANETLTARLQAREQDIVALKHSFAEEQRQKQEREAEVRDLHRRLEIGKLEYQDQAYENQRLLQEIRHLERRKHSSSGCSLVCADVRKSPRCERLVDYVSSDSDQKVIEEHLLAELKNKTTHVPADTEEEVEVTEIAREKQEEERGKPWVRLLYGNPYRAMVEGSVSQPPTLQTIIRSTLEEEAESQDAEKVKEGEAEEKESHDPLSGAAGEEGSQLPPPLEPEVVPFQSTVASVDVEHTAGEEASQEVFEDCDPAADDSFLDAIGEGMKICPVCQTSMLVTSDFEEHVSSHLGRICPVCRSMADDTMSTQDFEQHVNTCLDRDASSSARAENRK